MSTSSKQYPSHNPVRDAISALDLTYAAVGREIGVSAQAVSEIVHGRTTSSTARYSLAASLLMSRRQAARLHRLLAEFWPESEQLDPAA
jgi:hypothetical protein